MNEREAFEAAIRQDPYDQTSRLAFSDWLDEQGLDTEAEFQRAWTPEWQQAEDWLKAFCQRVNIRWSYFLESVTRCLDHEDFLIECTLDTSNLTGREDMTEMWKQVCVYLRVKEEGIVPANPFTCGGNCFPNGLNWEDEEDE